MPHPSDHAVPYSFAWANGKVTLHRDARGLETTSFWDKLGRWTTFDYNSLRQLQAVTNALNYRTAYEWCDCGHLEAVTDALGNRTQYYYDLAGRLTNIVYPGTNHQVNIAWNQLNQPTNVWDAQGSVTLGFNHQGLWTSASTTYGVVRQVVYDVKDRPADTLLPAGLRVFQLYDWLDRLTARVEANGNGDEQGRESFGYNANGWLTAHWTPAKLLTQYAYDAMGSLTNIDYPSSVDVALAYDANNRLTTLVDAAGTTSFAWTELDAAHRRTQQTFKDGNYADYGYDALGQLTSAQGQESGGTPSRAHEQYTYSYDAAGNLAHRINNTLTNTFAAIARDSRGRLDTNGVNNSTKSEFVYDGFGRRRIRREKVWQTGAFVQAAEVRYVYDGLLVIQERDANNVPLVSYTRGNDLSGRLQGAGGIGGLLALTQPSAFGLQHSCYHADGNGNVTCLINDKQAVVARYLYDPFGNLLAKSGVLADANLYRFSSKEVHPASGLVYFGYRFYEPNLQRWLNPDPLATSGRAPIGSRLPSRLTMEPWEVLEGPNVYTFSRHSPVNFVDVNGLWTIGIVFDFNFNLFVHVGFHFGGHIGRDPATRKWSGGFIAGPEGGAGMFPNASATANVMWTEAPSVRCLKRWGAFAGGGATMPVGATAGGDVLAIKNGNSTYCGAMGGVGLGGGWPADVYAGFSYDGGWDSEGGWDW